MKFFPFVKFGFVPDENATPGGSVSADSVDSAMANYSTVTTIEDTEKLVVKGKKLISLASLKTLLSSLFVKSSDIFTSGLIKSSLLPSIQSDVIELVEIASILGDVVGMVSGDKAFYTDDNKIYTYSGSEWAAPESPLVEKLYLCRFDNLTYKFNGTTLVATSSPLPYATIGQAKAGSSFVNVMTPYSSLEAFKWWVSNSAISGIYNKSIQANIQELTAHLLSINLSDPAVKSFTGLGTDHMFDMVDDNYNILFYIDSNGVLVDQSLKYERLRGKKIAILGDSISTYSGYIPSGNEFFFPKSGYGVDSVDKTWWKKLVSYSGVEILINQSWSGSRVTTTGTRSASSYFVSDSRINSLDDNGVPDYIIVFGGTNDFGQSDPASLGSYNYGGALDKNLFRQAYTYLVQKLQQTYKNSRLVICPPLIRSTESRFANNSTGWSQIDMYETIQDVSSKFGAIFIDLTKCGITYENADIYLEDGLHPNEAGMNLIAMKIGSELNKLV